MKKKSESQNNTNSNKLKSGIVPAQESEILSDPNSQNETEQDLNSEILIITMKIRDNHPELYKTLEETPMPISDENDPEITLKKLRAYKNSIRSILNTTK